MRDGFSVGSAVIRSLLGPLSARSGRRQRPLPVMTSPFYTRLISPKNCITAGYLLNVEIIDRSGIPIPYALALKTNPSLGGDSMIQG